VARCTRSRSGSSRSWPNHSASAGLCTSTGERVVGRSTPGSVTRWPTSELTSVDLPAPVEPPTTASSGASRVDHARDDVVLELVDHLQRGRALLVDAGELERQHGASWSAPRRRTRAVSIFVESLMPAGSWSGGHGVIGPAPPVRGRRSTAAPRDPGHEGLAAFARSRGRGAAQVAVVQEPELDRGLLVVAHRALGPASAADLLGVRAALRRAQVDDPADVGGRDQAALAASPSAAAASGARSARTRPRSRPQEERRRHQHDVDAGKPSPPRSSEVFQAAWQATARVADQRRSRATARGWAGDRDADADAGERGEERVRERAEQAADHEGAVSADGAAGPAPSVPL
jgi:hypothetical protein